MPAGAALRARSGLYLTDGATRVLAAVDGAPAIASHPFGKGRGVYMAGFTYSPENARLLLNTMLWAKGLPPDADWLTGDPAAEAAYYPASRRLVVINNSERQRTAAVHTPQGDIEVELAPCGSRILDI